MQYVNPNDDHYTSRKKKHYPHCDLHWSSNKVVQDSLYGVTRGQIQSQQQNSGRNHIFNDPNDKVANKVTSPLNGESYSRRGNRPAGFKEVGFSTIDHRKLPQSMQYNRPTAGQPTNYEPI